MSGAELITRRRKWSPTQKVALLEEVEDENEEGYVVCKAGETLDSRQTTLLKIFGVRMAEFRISPKAVWEKSGGTVREIGQMEVDDIQ